MVRFCRYAKWIALCVKCWVTFWGLVLGAVWLALKKVISSSRRSGAVIRPFKIARKLWRRIQWEVLQWEMEIIDPQLIMSDETLYQSLFS
ncbi:unnamed protein product [Cuscuta campestris]|uniref:Uncharacterized protein n=1 Tax=Cuscuta campestris TaxID=132261 RepID=A0A484LEW7_9ASTE|nr:unnamed protein product [Cuscuta campestris]